MDLTVFVCWCPQISLGSFKFSDDGRQMAYCLSSGGSDWVEVSSLLAFLVFAMPFLFRFLVLWCKGVSKAHCSVLFTMSNSVVILHSKLFLSQQGG